MVRTYRVAGHDFAIDFGVDFPFLKEVEMRYGPFELYEQSAELLFDVAISDTEIDCGESSPVYTNQDDVKEGFITFSVFRTLDKSYYFEITQPNSPLVNGRMLLSSDFAKVTLYLSGSDSDRWNTFNTAINLSFQLATACHNTLLFHASAVEYKGSAYLFLGRSGTGKSTHSQMWIKAIDGVTLVNDDHPIVRVDNGNITVYGSPWSGKTHCYKNVHYPLGAIVRIVRAPHNRAIKLSPIESYASIMTSCGGMVWERKLADGRDLAIQAVISQTPCWKMECLPNEDAAVVASAAVTKHRGRE